MTDKELRKLRRDDLLQILIDQQHQIEDLNEALQQANTALEDRRITIEESGSIAEAALRLTNVFGNAQDAANLYLEQVRAYVDDIRSRADAQAAEINGAADRVLKDATARADEILKAANNEADRIRQDALQEVENLRQQSAEAMRQAQEKHDNAERLMRRAQELISERTQSPAPADAAASGGRRRGLPWKGGQS